MYNRYEKIRANITTQYYSNYLNNPTSKSLVENIIDLTLDDIIYLLKTVRDNPELSQMSHCLSRRSNLFDKLILMRGDKPHDWALRLHLYNVVGQCDAPGYVISNLNKKIRDDENQIHEHSWNLASKFLIGGFKNHQYARTAVGPFFNRYNLVPTINDEVTQEYPYRKAMLEGQTGLMEITEDLYQQGDLVHYPKEIPHKIDNRASSYLGMTITLAHTSERHRENSIFYELPDQKDEAELAIAAQKYTRKTHQQALNMAITNLELIKLCDQLAEKGFKRFNRFVDPITNQMSPNNVLETELLPTIAMLILQRNNEFVEHPLTTELLGRTENEILELKEKYAGTSGELKQIIEDAILDMSRSSLNRLIQISQQNLIAKLYTAYPSNLNPDVQEVLNKRATIKPEHVLSNLSFYSNYQQVSTEASMVTTCPGCKT